VHATLEFMDLDGHRRSCSDVPARQCAAHDIGLLATMSYTGKVQCDARSTS
jgi:hypothetical protein